MRETVGGLHLTGTEAYKIALDRSDLKPMKLNTFLGNYGWLCLILLPFGFLQAGRRLGEARYRTVFIGGVISIALILLYVKYRMVALPSVTILAGLGGAFLLRGPAPEATPNA